MIDVLGWMTVAFFVIFIFLAVLNKIWSLFKKPVNPSINPDNMPKLSPIPIPTKNRKCIFKILVWIFEVRKWKLLENSDFKIFVDNSTVVVTIPKGYVFDGASIPRPFWFLLSPTGLLLIPALIHDYGYCYNQLWEKRNGKYFPFKKDSGRVFWDKLFWKIGKDINNVPVIDFFAFLGVYFFGIFTWRRHRKNEEIPSAPE